LCPHDELPPAHAVGPWRASGTGRPFRALGSLSFEAFVEGNDDGVRSDPERGHVRARDVWTVIWVGLVVAAGLFLLYEVRRVLIWLLVAIFFAAVLSPLVAFLVRRGLRRSLAVVAVILALFVVGGGLAYLIAKPLVSESIEFARDLPDTVERLRNAPIVRQTLQRFNIQNRIEEVSRDIPRQLIGLSGPLLSAFVTVGQLIIGLITIVVMTIFLLLYGPQFVDAGMELIAHPGRRARVERIGRDSLGAVSGWVAGNVGTSIIAFLTSMVTFVILGMPYAVLLGLWVGVADLIPLVGATLGAIPAIIVAFFHSVVAGIVVTVFFIVYQQFENHVLQPAVYGKTIKLNPFLVLVAVLVGVELAGFLGALLALPVAGILQIVIVDAIRSRRSALLASDGEPAERKPGDSTLITTEGSATDRDSTPSRPPRTTGL
jgi:predicted PurR-regulated permease PerM